MRPTPLPRPEGIGSAGSWSRLRGLCENLIVQERNSTAPRVQASLARRSHPRLHAAERGQGSPRSSAVRQQLQYRRSRELRTQAGPSFISCAPSGPTRLRLSPGFLQTDAPRLQSNPVPLQKGTTTK